MSAAVSYLDSLFTQPSNLIDELDAGPKMGDLCGSIINDNNLDVRWEKGDQLVLNFYPKNFCENPYPTKRG